MDPTKRKKRFDVRLFWLRHAPDGAGDTGGADDGGGGGNATAIAESEIGGAAADAAAQAVADEQARQAQAEASKNVDWKTVVPQDYREKPYMKGILEAEDPTSELFKSYDNLQTKLGQRPEGIPKPEAAKEEWDAFYNSLGRPENIDGYEIPKNEWSDEDKEVGQFVESFRGNEAFEKDVKQMFHDEGLSKKQAANIAQKYDQLVVKHNKPFFEEAKQAQQNYQVDYEKQFKEAFGNRAEEAQGRARQLLEKTLPANLKPMLQSADPKTLMLLTAGLDGVMSKYISEDQFDTKGSSGTMGGDEASVRAECSRLMAQPEYFDVSHPLHESTKAKVNALYDSIDYSRSNRKT